MARSEIRTMLPLDRFTQIVSYSPILFNQVFVRASSVGEMQDATACSDPVMQYTWQPRGGGRPGRDEIAQAIAQAEEAVTRWLGFTPIPQWVTDDSVVPGRSTLLNSWKFSVRASMKYVIQGGIEAWSLISANSPITYSDLDGDGYFERATVAVALPAGVTDVNEIVAYYPGEDHNDSWEIRPIKVVINSGVATITFNRHQAVQPDLLTALDASGVDGVVDANFLTGIDVYRKYNSPAQMAIAEWQPSICNEAACMVEADTGCFEQVNERAGIVGVHAGSWDAGTLQWTHTCCPWWRRPNRVRLWYRAGYRDKRLVRNMHDMAPDLERAISFLALSYLDREWQGCEYMHNIQDHWRTDLARRDSNPGGSVSFQVSQRVLDNPFGTTRAAVFAWSVVQPKIVGEAVLGT